MADTGSARIANANRPIYFKTNALDPPDLDPLDLDPTAGIKRGRTGGAVRRRTRARGGAMAGVARLRVLRLRGGGNSYHLKRIVVANSMAREVRSRWPSPPLRARRRCAADGGVRSSKDQPPWCKRGRRSKSVRCVRRRGVAEGVWGWSSGAGLTGTMRNAAAAMLEMNSRFP